MLILSKETSTPTSEAAISTAPPYLSLRITPVLC